MVMRRSDVKRILKDSSDVSKLVDSPKRTKVHAQRKFAQGSGMNSPVMTPIKDKEKTKINGASSSPELLPSKRPKTEDFLTFLCFRGTEVLPSRLDFFNSASKSPNKPVKDSPSPSTSKQPVPQPENKVQKVKHKLRNTKVHSLKNKLHEKRLANTRSARLTQKSVPALLKRPRQIADERQKKISPVTKKQLVKSRPAHHPSILKRLGATRLRAGLRSGGQLPPGSEIGIKSDRKPRKKLIRAKIKNTKKSISIRNKVTTRKNSTQKVNEKEEENDEDDDDDDEDDDANDRNDKEDEKEKENSSPGKEKVDDTDEDEEESTSEDEGRKKIEAPKKTRALPRRTRPTSLGKNVVPSSSTRPTRKTKEVATIYMEMLTKDLRSPEEDEDDVLGEISASAKKADDKSEPTLTQNSVKKSIKNVDNQKEVGKEAPIQTRASRRGKAIPSTLRGSVSRENVRITRAQRGGKQWGRGRPSLRRGRGRPPLTRAPAARRELRNINRVTNFAEDETESEEDDEMFVESILSEEVASVKSGPVKKSTSATSINKKNNKIEKADNEVEANPLPVGEKSLNKRKIRVSSNSTVRKSGNESSEEDSSKRQTRSSKDKDDIKEKKKCLVTRRNRPSDSESEEEEEEEKAEKEKPLVKRGRKNSVEKTKEISKKEQPEIAATTSKGDNLNLDKKNIIQEKKEPEESSLRVTRNQSDQSVAYLLLSLAQMKGWQGPEDDYQAVEENNSFSRNTRSSVKDPPKEIKGKRGRKRNTSSDSLLVVEKTDEEKQPAQIKRNKRDSLASETSQKIRTTRSSKGEASLDERLPNKSATKVSDSEISDKKVNRINKNRIQESKSSSESEDDKDVRKIMKSVSDDNSSVLSQKRSAIRKMSTVESASSSESDINTNIDKKTKEKINSSRDKNLRKRSKVVKEEDNIEQGENYSKADVKNSVTLDSSLKISALESGCQKMKMEKIKLKEEDIACTLSEAKDSNNLTRKTITMRKHSADSNNSCSGNVDCAFSLKHAEKTKPLSKKSANLSHVDSKRLDRSDDDNLSDSESNSCHQELPKNNKPSDKAKMRSKRLSPDLTEENESNETKKKIIERSEKNKRIKAKSESSDESDEEISEKSAKGSESKINYGARKRFPRRSKVDYYKDIPRRTIHNRKVKSVNERYIDEDSYSSDSSTTSEESRIPALRSQKRIKPKNSTQNDAIESAMREAQNAVLKLERKEIDVYSAPVKFVKDKCSENLCKNAPVAEISLKKEIIENIHKINDNNNLPQSSSVSAEEKTPLETPQVPFHAISVNSVGKVPVVHQYNNKIENVVPPQNSNYNNPSITGFTKSPPSVDTKHCKVEQLPPNNPAAALVKTNLFNSSTDLATGKPIQFDSGEKKQSMSETWRQAFKNAKIPKPGQSSPVPHGVKPFVRKPFTGGGLGTKQELLKNVNVNLSKVSSPMNQFKSNAFQSLGKYSPNRTFPSSEDSTKSLSPSRKPVEVRDSPSKSSVSSSEDSRAVSSESKKNTLELPVKSLTQLQYEKRSSDLISSLKDAPIILDPSYSVAPFTSKLKEAANEATPSRLSPSNNIPASCPLKPSVEGGKHLNLPLAVEHTLRKMSPITVSKKPLVVKNLDKKVSPNPCLEKQKEIVEEVKDDSTKSDSQIEETTAPRTTNIEMLGKKKVNMTTEEIKRWLDDSTSSGIEHAKDCGIFEKNQCECSYRTSGASMLVGRVETIRGEASAEVVENRNVMAACQSLGSEVKVDRGFVEPPVQLRELAEIASKYGGETISTCKVEDYRERVLSKNKELLQKLPKRQTAGFKSVRSMTEEEMFEFDFKFDRSSNSPRESGSEMSSPPPLRDDLSEKSDVQHSSPSERKTIFQQRRSCGGASVKRPPQSKSPAAAFSAENESSVYAFKPEEPPVSMLDKPFRRRSSKGTRDDETLVGQQQPPSSSIAVQVNLENEALLETEAVLECCTTQTEHSQDDEENGGGGRSFYIPIEQSSSSQLTPQQTIKGVTLKVESDGANNQRVMLRAKLVTKPPATFATPTTSPGKTETGVVVGTTSSSSGTGGGSGGVTNNRRRPEQKVRPLSSARAPPPVGTVQPTLREGTDQNVVSACGLPKVDKPKQASQGTQSSPSSLGINLPVAADSGSTLKEKGNLGALGNSQAADNANNKNIPQQRSNEDAKMLEAPTFYPTEKEFGDPLEYIEKITPLAQQFGICRIVPPASFKPECKVSDDMRFTAYNQYIHKMLHRWGPNVREMSAIRKYLATQNIALNQPPYIGGMEVDLPRLYQTVQQCGGLKEVYEKKRWTRVADAMKIPRSAQDRVTKLDDIYCKFLLPYDTLSHSERSKLLEEVEIEWREREKKMLEEDENQIDKDEGSDNESDSDERDECVTKGKSVALSGFYRIARNTMSMWFSKDSTPSPVEVEHEFWRHVTTGSAHVCVHSGSIDTGTWGCGFPTVKERSSARHPWNLKILTNNPRSILRSLGPVIGVTVPTLHVGMLFSACCWYRDPHALPWIEYLHTGASKIWYGVPDSWSEELKAAVKRLMPRYCREKKKIWLASDTVMVPPQMLVSHGVSVCRTVQEPGHFVVVFPRAFTSSFCTGYLVSESVYFAHSNWLDTSRSVFNDIQESSEPPIFSLEKLLFNIATDIRSSAEVLTQILPMVIELRDKEISSRKILEGFGLVADEKLPVTKGRRTKSQEEPNEYECEICRGNLFLSLVTNTQDEINYCLVHAIEIITKDKDILKHCKLMYAYDEDEMEELIGKIKTKIEIKNQKKQGKIAINSSSSKS